MDDLVYKGEKIEFVDWPHLQSKTQNTITAYHNWIKEQEHEHSSENLRERIDNLAKNMQIPLSSHEITRIVKEVPNYSGIPILSEIEKNKNPNDRLLLYLGAGMDLEHTSLFMCHINLLVDPNYETNSAESLASHFRDIGYEVTGDFSSKVFTLGLKLNGKSKRIVLIKEDMTNHECIYEITRNQGHNEISVLINKKTSRHKETLPFLDQIEEGGFFLQSDIQVFKQLPNFRESWYGVLCSYKLQVLGGTTESENYPSKLFQKI